MIFLSHNYNDKDFVGPLANELSNEYGQDNIFFDEWSIRPGENIIEKMNEGLENCEFFFLFMSKDSLTSEMVTLEWTSTLKEKSKRDIQFITIKCDDSEIPMILSSLNYLDMYTNGFDITLRQIIELINKDFSEKEYPAYNNLQGYILGENKNKFSLFVVAKRFFEPSSIFLIATNANEEDVNIKFEKQNMYNSSFNPDAAEDLQGNPINIFVRSIQGGIKKGFKYEISFEALNDNVDFIDFYHMKTENKFDKIPLKIISKISEVEV